MKKRLYVCFTMDVERIKSLCPPGGPPTWEVAELAVRSYCEGLREIGCPATLFIVPDTAEKQAPVFHDLRKDGHECGMHLHPQGWRDNYKNPDAHDYLGGYPADEQLRILGEARDQWTNALGLAPAAFRSGNYSANDSTFGVLEALRFTCSSISQPGRFAPQFKAVWTGAPRGVHHAHRTFRLLEGDLDLVEVPPTVDATRTDHWSGVGDARLEDWALPDIVKAIEDSLNWQIRNRAPVHHICLFTHNYVNFSQQDVEVPAAYRNLMVGKSQRPLIRGIVDALSCVASQHGMAVESCTLSRLREEYLASQPDRRPVPTLSPAIQAPLNIAESQDQEGKVGPEDRRLWERAREVIPWGTQTNAKRRPEALADAMPAFIVRAEGCRAWDADGRVYLDFDCSLGPIILGHGYPAVNAAVRRQLEKGVLFSMASPLEVEVAEMIQKAVPCAERVRFLKTGADANSACVRLARVATGRDMIVITAYHGWPDPFMGNHPGVPEPVRSLTVVCPYGDAEAVTRAFEQFPGRIAAILTVPYDWRSEPSPEYLRNLREQTSRHGALLIFDEVLTGFRIALGGAQEYFGVTPDLVSFAKALANGFPLAAFAGRKSVMEEGLEKTIITTTYAGEALSLAAARATLETMLSKPVHQHIWRTGELLMDGISRIFRERKVPAVVMGLPPHFYTLFQTGDPKRDQVSGEAFARELLHRGIFYRGNRWFISYSHGDEEVRETIAAVGEAVENLP